MALQEVLLNTPPKDLYFTETHCPSCGRFVGTFERCPYCQTLTRKRISIQVFKILAVLTSTVGLAMLLFFAQSIQTPEVTIESLGPLSNFGHVKVRGIVDKSFGVHPQWHSLGFTLSQKNSGGEKVEMRISAYSKTALEIEKKDLVPREGDEVTVEGQVRFQKDSPSLLINASEHLVIVKRAEVKADCTEAQPGRLDNSLLGKKVSMRGKINETLSFPRGTLVKLEDGGNGQAVWLPSQILTDLDVTPNAGDEIEVIGKVKTYKDSLEIEVLSEKGCKVFPAPKNSGSAATSLSSPEK